MNLFGWMRKPELSETEKKLIAEKKTLEEGGTINRLQRDIETQRPYLVLRSDGSKSRGRIAAISNPLVDLAFVDEKDGVEKYKTVRIIDFLNWQ